MIRVAVDVAHLTITQMHANAATTGAHVAGGLFDFLHGLLCHSLLVPQFVY
jgi:hypothetical protein